MSPGAFARQTIGACSFWKDDDVTRTQRRRISTASAIGYGAALTLGVLGLLGLVVAAHAEGVSWLDAFSVLLLIPCGILLLTFGLLQLYTWLSRNRAHRLNET
jgi:protein-S-isoprenylcysteine O-methyltransferase Ste14